MCLMWILAVPFSSNSLWLSHSVPFSPNFLCVSHSVSLTHSLQHASLSLFKDPSFSLFENFATEDHLCRLFPPLPISLSLSTSSNTWQTLSYTLRPSQTLSYNTILCYGSSLSLYTFISVSININYKTLRMKCQQLVTTYSTVMTLCPNTSTKFAYTHPTSHKKIVITYFIFF